MKLIDFVLLILPLFAGAAIRARGDATSDKRLGAIGLLIMVAGFGMMLAAIYGRAA